MTNALEALLGAEVEVEASVHIKRLGTDLTFKALDGKTFNNLRAQATITSGKGANKTMTVDESALSGLLISRTCTNLSFSDAKLLAKFNASDEVDCVQKALLAGEIVVLTKEIMSLSGFDGLDAQIEKAKN